MLPARFACFLLLLACLHDPAPRLAAQDAKEPAGAKPKDAAVESKPASGLKEVRKVLELLRLVGERQGANGNVTKIMLGDMILQAGQVVPPLFANQTGMLRVKAIAKGRITFIWKESGKDDVTFPLQTETKHLLKARDPFEGKQF
jgi:hypothetical protein